MVEGFFDFTALGFKARQAEVSSLWAGSLQAQNTLANPEAIRRTDRTEKLKGGASFKWDIPACSVSLVVLKL
jgi:alpha-L-arabinofuranosidase